MLHSSVSPLAQATLLIRQRPVSLAHYPVSIDQAYSWIEETVQEIVHLAAEGHTPYHPQVPWRIAFLMNCSASACIMGLPAQQAEDTLRQALDTLEWGITIQMAHTLFNEWYLHLEEGTPAEHVDQHVLGPKMKEMLQGK